MRAWQQKGQLDEKERGLRGLERPASPCGSWVTKIKAESCKVSTRGNARFDFCTLIYFPSMNI